MGNKVKSVEDTSQLDVLSCEEIVEYLIDRFEIKAVLSEFDSDDLRDHISDEYFIADDEDDAIELLEDVGYLEFTSKYTGRNLPNFRKKDVLSLIEGIANREGWDYLYSIIEPQREKLHIL